MKIKLTVHMEREFSPMVEFYTDQTPEGILRAELKNYEEDPGYLLEFADTKLTVKGEIIES